MNANETIVVGDSVVDMRSAKALNATAVGIAKESDAIRKLNHAGAVHTIESITDLPILITKLNKNEG